MWARDNQIVNIVTNNWLFRLRLPSEMSIFERQMNCNNTNNNNNKKRLHTPRPDTKKKTVYIPKKITKVEDLWPNWGCSMLFRVGSPF